MTHMDRKITADLAAFVTDRDGSVFFEFGQVPLDGALVDLAYDGYLLNSRGNRYLGSIGPDSFGVVEHA